MANDIKIFVSHRIDKDSEILDNPLFVPVRCGATFDERSSITMLGDNTGDNISEKRMTYCEMTVQYWAWKNVSADYYGLCHYRRYLNFSNHRYLEDAYGSVCADFIDEDAVRLYGLSQNQVEKVVSKYDLVIPEPRDLTTHPETPGTVWEQWCKTPYLHESDLECAVNIIARKHPDYLNAAYEYLHGTKAYFCAMFVMKRDEFVRYSEWLYDILGEFESIADMSLYTEEGARTPGHLAERLFGIYICHLRKNRPELKIKELQTVIFFKPERFEQNLPAAFEGEKVVPIALSANDGFAPMLSTTIQSIIDTSSTQYKYDIVVLHRDISNKNQSLIVSQAKQNENISIRFYNTERIISQYNLQAGGHISVETYYRFLIQDILNCYKKVLYLDCDLVCKKDVSELFETNVSGYMLAAAADPDMLGQMQLNPDIKKYVIKELKMDDPYMYFQAGVLLLNAEELRRRCSMYQWLDYAKKRYVYNDQDVLNRYCYGQVKYLDMMWNMIIDCDNYRVPVIINSAPARLKDEYSRARKAPAIIHYAGYQKPWNNANCDFSEEFWMYARKTPFFETLFAMLHIPIQSMASNPVPNIGVKGALIIYFKKHLPKRLWPFARKVKALLRW